MMLSTMMIMMYESHFHQNIIITIMINISIMTITKMIMMCSSIVSRTKTMIFIYHFETLQGARIYLDQQKTLDCTKVTVDGLKQIFKLNPGRKISTRELKQPQFQEQSGSYVQLQIITTRYKYKICQIQRTLCFDEDILRSKQPLLTSFGQHVFYIGQREKFIRILPAIPVAKRVAVNNGKRGKEDERGKSKKEPREAGLTIYLLEEENSDQCSDEIFANIFYTFEKISNNRAGEKSDILSEAIFRTVWSSRKVSSSSLCKGSWSEKAT